MIFCRSLFVYLFSGPRTEAGARMEVEALVGAGVEIQKTIKKGKKMLFLWVEAQASLFLLPKKRLQQIR